MYIYIYTHTHTQPQQREYFCEILPSISSTFPLASFLSGQSGRETGRNSQTSEKETKCPSKKDLLSK